MNNLFSLAEKASLNTLFSLVLTVATFLIALLNVGNGHFNGEKDSGIDFYVKLPDKPNDIFRDKVDLKIDEPLHFQLICEKFGRRCTELSIYGDNADDLVAQMKLTKRNEYANTTKGIMNANFIWDSPEVPTKWKIDLNVTKAFPKMFKPDNFTCVCDDTELGAPFPIWDTIELNFYGIETSQHPRPPYVNGQKVTLSCAGWPSKTQFTIKSDQQEFCKKEVENSTDFIKCEVDIDYLKHKNMQCVANKSILGVNTKPFKMTFYGLHTSQVPDGPYLGGQKIVLSCAAWPPASNTQFTIKSDQQDICKKEVESSEKGISCEIELDYSKHRKMQCVAKNSERVRTKSFDLVIHGNGSWAEKFAVYKLYFNSAMKVLGEENFHVKFMTIVVCIFLYMIVVTYLTL